MIKKLLLGTLMLATIKCTATLSIDPHHDKNWFPNEGYFHGGNEKLPVGWNFYHTKFKGGVAFNNQLSFERSDKVLIMTAQPDNDLKIQTGRMPLPETGTFEFSIWARSMEKKSKIILFLGGTEGYKWNNSKSFQLSDRWLKCSVAGIVPEKGTTQDPFTCCRITIPQGQTVAIGRMELRWIQDNVETETFKQYPVNVNLSRNLVFNPDFELGGFGWEKYYSSGSIYSLTGERLSEYYQGSQPQIVNDGVDGGHALKVVPSTALMSFCFPVVIGKEYTMSAFLKCATISKIASCRISLVANNMKNFTHRFNVTDQWKRYSFSTIWNIFSQRKNAYIRIDVDGTEPILLDRVQAEQGKLSEFSTFPVQLGLVGSPNQKFNIFDDTNHEAEMILKAVCSPKVKGQVSLKAIIADSWGRIVSSHQFKAEAAPVLKFPVKVNKTGQRGVFHATLQVFDSNDSLIGSGISRYAVCRNLSQIALPDNPIAGHFEMYSIRYSGADQIMPVLKNYFPLNKFNRCFFQYTPEHLQSPQFVPDLNKMSEHWTFSPNVTRMWCMFWMSSYFEKYFGEEILKEKLLSQESLDRFKHKLTTVISTLKDNITCWELLNEPYGWRLAAGPRKNENTMEPEKAAQLYKAAYEVIKSIDPKIDLVGPCVGLNYNEWMKRFLEAGGGKWIDIFTVHGYCDNPDVYDTFGKISDFRNMLAQYGCRNIKIWNTEQYFGARIPYKEHNEDEYTRYYFSDREIDHVTAMVSNLINHAAAGVPVAAFAFRDTSFEGIGKEFFFYDYFAAANCAAEFLGNAKLGAPVEMGGALRCFLFPKAKNGALATIHTVNQNEKGTMSIPLDAKAYDMMGNQLVGEKLTLDHSIIYFRFPVDMSKIEVEKRLSNMRILGLGKAFSLAVTLADKNTLTVAISNRLNHSSSGKVTIEQYPKGWTLIDNELRFSDLKPGSTVTLCFRGEQSELRPLNVYKFRLKINTGKEFFFEDVELTSLYAQYNKNIQNIAGSGNLDAWQGIKKISLGKDHLSKKFSPLYDWTGPQDLSAELMVAWNKKGLGIGIIVTDDIWYFSNSHADSWQADSIQLYFDMKNDADIKNKNTMDDASYMISFNGKTAVAYMEKGPTGRFIGEQNLQTGIDTDVKVTCRKLTNNKLFYDIFLPSNILPLVNFKDGTALGFSLLINDNDGKGRKTGLTLAPKGKEPFNAPHEYVDLILIQK